MKIEPGMNFKVCEHAHGIVITFPTMNLRGEGVEQLVIADRNSLVEYLGQYLAAREAGKSLQEAHDIAMRHVQTPRGILLS